MSNEPFHVTGYDDDAKLVAMFGEFGEYSVTNNFLPDLLWKVGLTENESTESQDQELGRLERTSIISTTEDDNHTDGFVTDQAQTKKRRKRISNRTGPYKCKQIDPSTGKLCNFEFSRVYDLDRHERAIHSAEKEMFSCTLCKNKAYSRRDLLLRHMRTCRTATTEDPSKDQEQLHMGSQVEPHESKQADLLSGKSGRESRETTIHGLEKRMFPCLLCTDETFSRLHALQRHLRREHPEGSMHQPEKPENES